MFLNLILSLIAFLESKFVEISQNLGLIESKNLRTIISPFQKIVVFDWGLVSNPGFKNQVCKNHALLKIAKNISIL